LKTPEKKCPFCNIAPEQIIVEHSLAVAKHDGYWKSRDEGGGMKAGETPGERRETARSV